MTTIEVQGDPLKLSLPSWIDTNHHYELFYDLEAEAWLLNPVPLGPAEDNPYADDIDDPRDEEDY